MKDTIYIACGFLLLLVSHAGPAASANGTPSLEIDIIDVRNGNGNLNVAVFASPEGFPDKPGKAINRLRQPIAGAGTVQVEVALPAGKYAVAVFHDEDGDGKLRKNFLGVPTEGTGFSNNPATRFGPPKFKDCLVPVGGGKVTIKLNY